jgi:uncharacterized membrane protein
MQIFVRDKPEGTKIIWVLLACLCIGSIPRIHNFWLPDLWLDEYGTWWVVSAPNWAEVAERAIKTQGQSAFYYLIVKVFTGILGEGPLQLRLPSVIFGISTLFVTYRLAILIFQDQAVALASVAVFSVNEQLIWFSQIARPYALALFLTLMSFLFFLQFLRSGGAVAGISYAVTTALLIYSHFLFAFVVVVHIAFATLKLGWREMTSSHWIWVLLLIGVLCLPISGQIVNLYERRQTLDWIPHFQQSFQASVIARGFANPWALVLATIPLLAIGIRPIDLYGSPAGEFLFFLALWMVIPIAALWAAAHVFEVSFLEARYILFVYPAAFYLWAWLMLQVKRNGWLRWLPTCVFLMATFTISLIPRYIETGNFRDSEKWGWDQAAKILVEAGGPGDLVVIYTGFVEADLFVRKPQDPYMLSYVGWPLIAHLPRNHILSLVSLPLLQNERTNPYIKSLELEAAKHDRVWVIGPDQQREYFNQRMITEFGFTPAHSYSSTHKIKASLLLRSRR